MTQGRRISKRQSRADLPGRRLRRRATTSFTATIVDAQSTPASRAFARGRTSRCRARATRFADCRVLADVHRTAHAFVPRLPSLPRAGGLWPAIVERLPNALLRSNLVRRRRHLAGPRALWASPVVACQRSVLWMRSTEQRVWPGRSSRPAAGGKGSHANARAHRRLGVTKDLVRCGRMIGVGGVSRVHD